METDTTISPLTVASVDRNAIPKICCISGEESNQEKTLMQQVPACSLLLGGGYSGKCQKLLTAVEVDKTG